MDLFLKSSLFRDGFSVDVVSYYYTHGTARSMHKPPMIHITCTLSFLIQNFAHPYFLFKVLFLMMARKAHHLHKLYITI